MKSQRAYRLSPNEEAAIIRKQQEEQRKMRLIQVREQDRGLAQRVREGVHNKKKRERHVLENHLQANLANAHQEELRQLEARYLSRVKQLGQGHRAAEIMMQEENKLQELQVLLVAEQKWRAEDRHKMAMKELNANQLCEDKQRRRSAENRMKALEVEKERAHKIANMPSSNNQPIILNFVASYGQPSNGQPSNGHPSNGQPSNGQPSKGQPSNGQPSNGQPSKGQRVQFKESDSYACTYYHIPHTLVQKDHSDSDSANKAAQEKNKVDEQLRKDSAINKMEQDEKARLRHKHALAKVKLEREKTAVLSQLEILEREDRTQRQKALAKMPNTLFRPIHQRLAMASEQQRDMEQAFEKLFVKNHRTHYEVLPREDATSDVQSNVLPVDQKESTSITLASDGPVRRERIKTTSPQGEAHIMAPEYSHTLMDSSLGTGSGVSHTSTLDTHGLSTDDIVPSNKRHHPISPPKHPLKLLNIKGHDVTDPSTIDSPLQPHLMDFASKFTQTQLPKFCPPKLDIHLPVPPELSVTDTVSSLSSEGVSTRNKEPETLKFYPSKPPKPPYQRDYNEGIKKLASMVKAQHEAWKERQAARLAKVSSTDDSSSVQIHKKEERSTDSQSFSSETQQEFISIHTLSTGDSILSTEQGGAPHLDYLSSRSHTNSPAPLSISQYHTTLEASSLSPEKSLQDHSLNVHQPDLSIGTDVLSTNSLSITPYNTTLDVSTLTPPRDHSAGLLRDSSIEFPSSQSHDFPDLPSQWRDDHQLLNLHKARVEYTSLDTHRNLSLSTTTVVEHHETPVDTPSDVCDQTIYTATQSNSQSPDEPNHIIDDRRHLNLHRARVQYSDLDTCRNLSVSTETATEYYVAPTDVPSSTDRTAALVNSSLEKKLTCSLANIEYGSTNPLSIKGIGHLAAPSLDVTSSSVTEVPTITNDLQKHESSDVSSSLDHACGGSISHPLHSFQRSTVLTAKQSIKGKSEMGAKCSSESTFWSYNKDIETGQYVTAANVSEESDMHELHTLHQGYSPKPCLTDQAKCSPDTLPRDQIRENLPLCPPVQIKYSPKLYPPSDQDQHLNEPHLHDPASCSPELHSPAHEVCAYSHQGQSSCLPAMNEASVSPPSLIYTPLKQATSSQTQTYNSCHSPVSNQTDNYYSSSPNTVQKHDYQSPYFHDMKGQDYLSIYTHKSIPSHSTTSEVQDHTFQHSVSSERNDQLSPQMHASIIYNSQVTQHHMSLQAQDYIPKNLPSSSQALYTIPESNIGADYQESLLSPPNQSSPSQDTYGTKFNAVPTNSSSVSGQLSGFMHHHTAAFITTPKTRKVRILDPADHPEAKLTGESQQDSEETSYESKVTLPKKDEESDLPLNRTQEGGEMQLNGIQEGVEMHLNWAQEDGETFSKSEESVLSLKEAFLRKKLDFIHKSQARIKNLKANAMERQRILHGTDIMHAKRNLTPPSRHWSMKTLKDPSPNPGSDVAREERKKGHGKRDYEPITAEGAADYCPPTVPATSAGDRKSIPQYVLSSKLREKIKKQDMKERNLRFYKRLSEVKDKDQAEKRAKDYAEYRERAKQYQQHIRLKMKALQAKKKSKKLEY